MGTTLQAQHPKGCSCSTVNLLDSKWVLTGTHRYWRLLLHIFQASQNFASPLFPLPPFHTALCTVVGCVGTMGTEEGGDE